MIAELSRSILGPYGVLVLDFYLENQTLINLAVVVYGTVLILRHRHHRKNSLRGKSDATTKNDNTE